MRRRGCALVLGIVMGLMIVAAHAADRESRVREALRRTQQSAAKLQSEKTALAREKQELTAKMDAATKDLDGLKGETTRAKHRAAAANRQVDLLRKENAELKSRLASTGKNLADTSRQCREAAALAQHNEKRSELINTNLKAILAKEEGDRKTCVTNNLKLRITAHEILNRYQNKRPFESLLQAEPFTGIKAVEIETLVQDYADKIDGLSVGKP